MEAEVEKSKDFVSVMRHAWTFIDAVHRFRTVLSMTPGIKHNHIYELFIRRTVIVTEMRNIAQHLDQELDKIAEKSQGAYGTLSWVVGTGDEIPPEPQMLNLGTAYGRVVGPVTDVQERLPVGEIHRIRLELSNRLLMLSDVFLHLSEMVKSFEGPLVSFAEGKDRFGSDQFIKFNLIPVVEEAFSEEDI